MNITFFEESQKCCSVCHEVLPPNARNGIHERCRPQFEVKEPTKPLPPVMFQQREGHPQRRVLR